MDGLLIDWGGVLTTSVFEAFAGFERREGVDVRAAFRHDTPARQHLIDLESGMIDLAEFELRLGAALDVDPDDLANRLLADMRPNEELRAAVQRFHDTGVKTALVSNSWHDGHYDRELHTMFDHVVLSQALRIRKPAREIYEVALDRLQLPATACVFVDDLGGNLKPAKQLGMTTIKHEHTPKTVEALERLLLGGPS